jgi:hypothetical protein
MYAESSESKIVFFIEICKAVEGLVYSYLTHLSLFDFVTTDDNM